MNLDKNNVKLETRFRAQMIIAKAKGLPRSILARAGAVSKKCGHSACATASSKPCADQNSISCGVSQKKFAPARFFGFSSRSTWKRRVRFYFAKLMKNARNKRETTMQDHTKAVQIHIIDQSIERLEVAIEALRGAKITIQRGTNWEMNALESGLTASFLATAREIMLKESQWTKMLYDKFQIDNLLNEPSKLVTPALTLIKGKE